MKASDSDPLERGRSPATSLRGCRPDDLAKGQAVQNCGGYSENTVYFSHSREHADSILMGLLGTARRHDRSYAISCHAMINKELETSQVIATVVRRSETPKAAGINPLVPILC